MRIPLYAKNVLPWSNTPNKNERLLTLHGCNHILQLQLRKWNNKHDNNYSSSEVLARYDWFSIFVKAVPSKKKKKFRHLKKKTQELKWQKAFLVGLERSWFKNLFKWGVKTKCLVRIWGKKQYFGLIQTKIYCNHTSMNYNSIHLFFFKILFHASLILI